MKTYAFGIALSALLAAGQAAAFQDTPQAVPFVPPVGHGMPDSSVRQEYDSRRMRNEAATGSYATPQAIARCLVGKAKTKAGGFLGGEMTADMGYKNLQVALGGKYSTCVSSTATNVQMPVLDGAVAEELLKLQLATLADRSTPTEAAAAKAFSTGTSGVTIMTIGRCVAAYSPGLAMKVLATPAGSAVEQQQLLAAYRGSPECGRNDIPTNIPLDQQRAAVASGLYHWLHRA